MNPYPYDAILVERPITPQALQLVTQCKNMGVIAWIELDDDLLRIPDYNNSQDFFSVPQHVQTIQQIIATADLVTVSTPHLQKLYGSINRNTRVIPNAWCDYRFPLPQIPQTGRPIKMAWRGSNKHSGDIYEVKTPVAQAMQDPSFGWTFFGDRPHFLNIPRKNYRPFSGLFSFFRDFILSKPDFLVVPLLVNDFNKSKSNCSWIEATMAGAATIAPMGLPEFDQPGIIRYKDNAHLKKIFDMIKKGKIDKREQVEASREALVENFRLSKVNELRINALADALQMYVPVEKEVEHGG